MFCPWASSILSIHIVPPRRLTFSIRATPPRSAINRVVMTKVVANNIFFSTNYQNGSIQRRIWGGLARAMVPPPPHTIFFFFALVSPILLPSSIPGYIVCRDEHWWASYNASIRIRTISQWLSWGGGGGGGGGGGEICTTQLEGLTYQYWFCTTQLEG
jgi:hypothetical protein